MIALLLLVAPWVAWAQEKPALTEAQVIQWARNRSPTAAVADATRALAEANQRAAGVPANPTLGWAREAVTTGPRIGQGWQDVFSVSIPLDVARPRVERALAASESSWAQAEASLVRTGAVLESLLTFYEVAFAERRVVLLTQALANLDEAARVLARREAAGSASGYESTRLAIASELARSELAEAQGDRRTSVVRLGAHVGVRSEQLRVSTDLAVSPSVEEAALRGSGGVQHSLARARASVEYADKAEAHAGWSWLPQVEIGAGLKVAADSDVDAGMGYVVGVWLGIPLFDRGQGQRAQARAQARSRGRPGADATQRAGR